MGEITLVRHGQANSSATTEADYDRLSDLGHMQAKWLGAWMEQHDKPFDTVISGTLRRQRETAANMGYPDPQIDARLNEIAYYDLTAEMEEKHNQPRPGPDDFVYAFPKVLTHWQDGLIAGTETYINFTTRVREILAEAAQPGRRILCVTSGGIIARAMAEILGLDIPQMARIALPILNTSVHRIQVTDHGPLVTAFNTAPHLDTAERAASRTNY